MIINKFATRLNSFKSNWKNPELPTILDLIKRASTVNGLTHVDLNFPDHSKPDLTAISKFTNDCGLKINGLAMRYYTNPSFKLGAFTNPDRKIRQEAIDLTKQAIDCLDYANSNLLTIWLGQDGFDYGFQVDYKKMWDDEISAIKEIAEHNKDCFISIEYKPNEPRAYSLLSNLHSTLLAISQIDLANLGVTLDFAHLLYANEQPAFSAAMVSDYSKLFGVHLNDGYAKRDDGLMVASVHYQATVELLYQITKDGYDGVIYFDTFPNITNLDPVKECQTNIQTVKQILKIVENLISNNNLSESMKSQDPITAQEIFYKTLNKINEK